MGLLAFEDADGVCWRVWRVETPRARAHLMETSFRNGWLVFEREDGSERRRLAQVPDDWLDLSAEHLTRLCRLAVRASPSKLESEATTLRMPIVPRPDDFRRHR